jgi:hypothetical protein
MLTSKDVLFLAALVTLIVVIVQRQNGKANRGSRSATTPTPVNRTSGAESDRNKDRRHGGK